MIAFQEKNDARSLIVVFEMLKKSGIKFLREKVARGLKPRASDNLINEKIYSFDSISISFP
jgi:hypothetical protein